MVLSVIPSLISLSLVIFASVLALHSLSIKSAPEDLFIYLFHFFFCNSLVCFIINLHKYIVQVLIFAVFIFINYFILSGLLQ